VVKRASGKNCHLEAERSLEKFRPLFLRSDERAAKDPRLYLLQHLQAPRQLAIW